MKYILENPSWREEDVEIDNINIIEQLKEHELVEGDVVTCSDSNTLYKLEVTKIEKEIVYFKRVWFTGSYFLPKIIKCCWLLHEVGI